jgi:hypothetical protein
MARTCAATHTRGLISFRPAYDGPIKKHGSLRIVRIGSVENENDSRVVIGRIC